ncbi:MAG TPA: hypothetical protein VIH05_06910, partial [Tepidiformaceae bacterium]
MSSPTFVDVPGLDFDWLNLDTEKGMAIQAGRRGLTLEDINVLTYGVESRDTAGIATFSPRGAAPDVRLPRHARQYKSKADVWSESAMLLYEEAQQRQWSSARDIPLGHDRAALGRPRVGDVHALHVPDAGRV